MRRAGLALLLVAAGCSSSDNLVVGAIGESNITPIIQFENINTSSTPMATRRATAPKR